MGSITSSTATGKPALLGSRPNPGTATPSQPAASPLGQDRFQSTLRNVQEEAADAIVALSNVPILANIGYKIYGATTKPKADAPPLANLGQLSPTLERGAQPTQAGFTELRKQGIDTVINLRPEANWEGPIVKGLGMNYLYMPLPAVGAPTNEQAMQFLRAVTDPANGKVYFHCLHGSDRTGAMAAAYRIAVDHVPVDKAIEEMGQYGFHAGFEDEKVVFVRQFADFWAKLDPAAKAQVLHQNGR
jgi:protein tyrosine phosphatase (PTP) superfamily phosphohydrolase (DUF442 family)